MRDLVSGSIRAEVPSLMVAAVAALGVAVFGGAGAAFMEWQPVTWQVMFLLAGTIVFVLLGYVASVSAMRVGTIAVVTPFRYTILLMAIVLGALLFGSLPNGLTLLGAAIVVGSGALTLMADMPRPRPEVEATPGL